MKKILRLLKRRKNGGFTLVEVIISSLLLGILILAVVGLITPVMQTVTHNEKNANALMIAEACEAHIDRNIKNSVYCAVFTNAQYSDITGDKINKHPAMQEMLKFVGDTNNKDIYELKAIGLRWQEDKQKNHYKYMLSNMTLKTDAGVTKITTVSDQQVFEECFYDNFFPAFTFDILPYTEYAADADGNLLDEDGNKAADTGKPPKVVSTRNVAIRTIIDVYSNTGMTALAAQGKGYAEFINIRTPAINRDGIYKLYSTNGKKDSDGNVIGGLEAKTDDEKKFYTELRTDDEFTAEFGDTAHGETYIFYVTRKLKYYEPPRPHRDRKQKHGVMP